MRQRAVLVVLAIIVVVGILAGVFYMKQSGPTGSTPPAETAVTPPPVSPPAGASVTPEAKPSGEPVAVAPGKVDLTVGPNGLSKTTVVIETQYGKIKFKFYPKDAPKTVDRMVELIGQGFYNGLQFHRVVPGFVVQGGDPKGDGTGGSGQHIKAEFNERQHLEGTVAMARAMDPDSADSQFYIALGPQPHLDRHYTVFGQVIEGVEFVKKIQVGDKMTKVSFE